MTFRLGLARGGPDPLTDSLLEAIACAGKSIDVRCEWVRDGVDVPACDAILVVGAPRSYAWFLDSPETAPRISWFGEPLPRPSSGAAQGGQPPAAVRSGGTRGTVIRAARRYAGPLRRMTPPGRLGVWREAVAIEHERVDNLAMAAWCRDRGARIVVTSRDRGASLAAAGIPASVVPFGYHPRHAGPLTPADTPRDIAVLLIGTSLHDTRQRRGRILARLRPGLQRLGQVVEIDGRWGNDRDELLRRTRVILDIQRVPGNFTGLRWLLASAAGAVHVVEPMDDPAPMRDGIDHVEAPSDELVEAVARLLQDEPRRRSMVDEAQRMLGDELAMHRSLERVLAG